MTTTLGRATVRFGRYTAEHRKVFLLNGYVDETQVVVALESEPINDVVARVQAHEPPVVVAVYFPDRTGVNEFSIVEFGPQATTGASVTKGKRDEPVVGTSTMGMFADILENKGAGKTYPISFRRSWSQLEARPFAHA